MGSTVRTGELQPSSSLAEEFGGDFESLDDGRRLRCRLTGHEMPADREAVRTHLAGKLFQRRKLESQLSKFGPHVRKSEEFPGKLYCALTGCLVEMKEAALWRHLMGKRFKKALEAKEAEKREERERQAKWAGGEGDTEMAPVEIKEGEKKVKRTKGGKGGEASGAKGKPERETVEKKEPKGKKMEEDEEEAKEMEKGEEEGEEEEEFWVPPVGDRWDNDTGGGRWGGEGRDEDMGEAESAGLEGEVEGGGEEEEVGGGEGEGQGEGKTGGEKIGEVDREGEGEQGMEEGTSNRSGQRKISSKKNDVQMDGGGESSSDEEDFFGRRPSSKGNFVRKDKREARMAVGGRVNAPRKKRLRPSF